MGWKALLWTAAVLVITLHHGSAKPIDKRGPPHPDPVEAGSKHDEDMGTGLEYDHYLRQVVEALESDEEFRKKLESANISDIKSGAIAMHLELVNHSIRSRLDEIKRLEVGRLQELALAKMKSMSGVGVNRMDIPSHLDLRNPHSFEMTDLESLIKKATNDLENIDRKRRDEFKTYEMEKEFQYQEKLKNLDEEEKNKLEGKHNELKEKHKQHEKINHPGSKDQFEEVWEKDDHLNDQDFDPKTFFFMHDLNGDKMWDITEVEAVLQRELDKVYDARNNPEEDDPKERFEEMSRMREHVFKEIDTNKDFMITLDEFLAYTGKTGENEKFKEDEGWETIDERDQFTDEEFEEYMRQHHPDRVPPGQHDSQQFHPEQHLQQPGQHDTLQFHPEGQQHLQQPGQHDSQQFHPEGQQHLQQQQAGQINAGQPVPPQPVQGQPVHGQSVQGHGQPIHHQPPTA